MTNRINHEELSPDNTGVPYKRWNENTLQYEPVHVVWTIGLEMPDGKVAPSESYLLTRMNLMGYRKIALGSNRVTKLWHHIDVINKPTTTASGKFNRSVNS